VHMQPRQRDQKHLRKGATGKATAEQRIQWGEPTTRGTIHVHGHRGTGCHERRFASQALATTGAILRRPCPFLASDARGRSEH